MVTPPTKPGLRRLKLEELIAKLERPAIKALRPKSWDEAQSRFFAEGGVFDSLYKGN